MAEIGSALDRTSIAKLSKAELDWRLTWVTHSYRARLEYDTISHVNATHLKSRLFPKSSSQVLPAFWTMPITVLVKYPERLSAGYFKQYIIWRLVCRCPQYIVYWVNANRTEIVIFEQSRSKCHRLHQLVTSRARFQNDYKTAHLVEQRSSGWNQALIAPMDTTRKLRLFNLLVGIGFEVELHFLPHHRSISFVIWLTIALFRADSGIDTCPWEINSSFESPGCKTCGVHLYNATSPVFRRTVFGLDRLGAIG